MLEQVRVLNSLHSLYSWSEILGKSDKEHRETINKHLTFASALSLPPAMGGIPEGDADSRREAGVRVKLHRCADVECGDRNGGGGVGGVGGA